MSHLSDCVHFDKALLTDEVITDLCAYHPCAGGQLVRLANIRASTEAFLKAVRDNCPNCEATTRALNKILDVRMLANQAIALEK